MCLFFSTGWNSCFILDDDHGLVFVAAIYTDQRNGEIEGKK